MNFFKFMQAVFKQTLLSHRLWLVFFWGIMQFTLYAQQECGTTIPENWRFPHEAFETFNRQFRVSSLEAGEPIPIKAHIIKKSDGSEGISENQLMVAIVALNERFKNTGMQFFLCKPIDYIDNDVLYNFNYSDAPLLYPYQEDKAINVYFANSVTTDKSNCGYAIFPGNARRYIMLSNICALNTSTFAHEMGHYWGLLHTFGGGDVDQSKELVNRSNCQEEGDKLCSTPADPGVDNTNVDRDCRYIGTKRDTNGQEYTPDVHNLMSYAPKQCRTSFTSQQIALMQMNFAQWGGNLSIVNCQSCNAPSDLKVSEIASSTATLHCAKIPNALRYQWQVKRLNDMEWLDLGTTTENIYRITDPILDRSTQYIFRVQVTYENGVCDLWTTKDFMTDACRLPGITGTSSSVTLDYISIVENSFLWQVCREDGSDCKEYNTTTPVLDLTTLGLLPTVNYFVQGKIKCLDGYGYGGWSHKFPFNQACKKAQNLIFEPQSLAKILFVTSDIFPNRPSYNIEYVEIQYREVGSSTWISVIDASGFFMLRNFLFNNKSYEFRVRHKCVSGHFTEWSAIHVFTDDINNKNPTVRITAPANNSTFTAPATILLTATATDADGTITNVQFVNRNVLLLGTATNSPYSFIWQNVPEGTYFITARAKDNKGGIGTSTPITIIVKKEENCASFQFDPDPITIGVYYPCDSKPYTAPTIGGQQPLTYKWSNGSTETHIPGNQPGNYTVTVTDAHNCSISKAIEVPWIEKPLVSIQANKAGGCSTNEGEAHATVTQGTSPYSYFWSNSQNTTTLSNVAAGTYTLTVSDDEGCTTQATVQIPLKTVLVSVSNIRNNQATVSFNALDAGVSYRIEYRIVGQSNGLSIPTTTHMATLLTGLSPNTNYQVSVIALCTGSNVESISNIVSFTTAATGNALPSVRITSPASNLTFTAPATITIRATATDADGTIRSVAFYNGTTLLGSDNTVPYQWTWRNVPAGTYTLTAKAVDNLGATTTSRGIVIRVNTAIICNTVVAITASPNCPAENSTLIATASRGTAPYAYRWNTGSTLQTLIDVPFGTYTVTVTDSKGCISTKSITTNAVYCPFNYDPVCGSDGKTYGNACVAECAGVTWTSGECPSNDSKAVSTPKRSDFYNPFIVHKVKLMEVSLYPNPTQANSILNISYEAAAENEVTITLEDWTGRRISTHTDKAFQGENHYKLDIPNLSPSIYMVRLQQGKEIFIRKLILM